MSDNALHCAMQLNGAATSLSEKHAVKRKLDVTKDADAGPAKKAKAEAKAAKEAKAEAKAAKEAKAEAKAAKEAKGKIEPKTTGAPVQLQFGTGTRDAPIDVDALSFTEQKREPKPAQIKPKCNCKACEKCHASTSGDYIDGVKCGRKCPACALFYEVHKKVATFTVEDKVYTGCSTCKIINERGEVSEICPTCFSRSCKKRAGSADKEAPLADMEVRLYAKVPGTGGMGLGGGFHLRTMPITQARLLFDSLGEKKSLARLLPEGAEGALKM
jgi:hypothetical protein